MGLFKNIGRLFTGSKGKHRQLSTLTPEQEKIQRQLYRAFQGPGAGGAFGEAADYWRNILSDDPETMRMLEAPEIRRFQEETIPGLSEQFAGMGAGGLSSSGFRNAAVNAGTDLSERLGAIRANLRQQAASSLYGTGTQALQPVTENIYQPGTPGLLDYASNIAGQALGSFGGDYISKNWLGQSTKGKTSPYGNLSQQAQNVRDVSQSVMKYR